MSRSAAAGERTAVVVGASAAGMLAAAALARAGHAVTVLERDPLPAVPRPRRGVPQGSQPHILLHRGLVAIEHLLPGFRTDLLARGAVSFDSGQMPWLGQFGWLDTSLPGFEVVSATRPLLEATLRDLATAVPGVVVADRITVRGLTRTATGWLTRTDDDAVSSRVVVDASGRSSRLEHWCPTMGAPPQEVVDARVGYAARLYREREPLPLHTGVMIFGTPEAGSASGLALPVEDRGWLVAAAGFGERRPPRDEAGFTAFLRGLRDPALGDLVARLEPVGGVAVHRQTSNRRRRWERLAHWPPGLLVVGDALCALDPVYGQGITVSAQQAGVLAETLLRDLPVDRSVQRRVAAITDVPWSIATTADVQLPSCSVRPRPAQRLSALWGARLARLAAAGNARATTSISAVNHLMASPATLLHPALLLAAARPLPATRLPRPASVQQLRRPARPPVGPAGA